MRKVFPTITDNYFIKDIKAEDGSVLARYTLSGLRTDDVLAVDITSSGVSRGLASQSGSYFYLKDGLGSVQAITTESGNLVQRYIYSSFGKLLKVVDAAGLETASFKTPFTYTNRELDEESGLYYFRARYYDAHSGRFLQEDPHPGQMSSPISLNSKYIYASNSPTNLIDPSGLFSIGKEFGNFFGGSGGWGGDLITAAVTIGVLCLAGATLPEAVIAVGAVALGSAVASGVMASFQGGDFKANFSRNFHTNFRISATFLAASGAAAGTFGGGIGKAGAGNYGMSGYVIPNEPYMQTAGLGSGLTMGSASTMADASWAGHEFGHFYHLLGASVLAGYASNNGGSSNITSTAWLTYGATGAAISPWDYGWW